jgi:hypothetical protein
MNLFRRIGTIKHKYKVEFTINRLTMDLNINEELSILVKRGTSQSMKAIINNKPKESYLRNMWPTLTRKYLYSILWPCFTTRTPDNMLRKKWVYFNDRAKYVCWFTERMVKWDQVACTISTYQLMLTISLTTHRIVNFRDVQRKQKIQSYNTKYTWSS